METTSNATQGVCAVDTETTGREWHDTAFLVTAAFFDGQGAIETVCFDLDSEVERREATEFLCSIETMVFHNAKFDLQKLILAELVERSEVVASQIHDTECLAHLLDEHRPKRLKALARDVLGLETDEDDVIKAERKRLKLTKDDGYDKLPREIVVPYALKDAEFTLRLFDRFYPDLVRTDDGLVALYNHELELTLALLDMEWEGMAVDTEYLDKTAKEYAGLALQEEIAIREISQVEDPKFPNSHVQIKEWFAEHGTTLSGTDKGVLGALDHPLAGHILELRRLRKIEVTYLRKLLKIERDGIVHPGIRQHGTVTGRSASGGNEGD